MFELNLHRNPDLIMNAFSSIKASKFILKCLACFLILVIHITQSSHQQFDNLQVKSEPFHLDLYHKFSLDEDFTQRASLLIRPRTDYRSAQASVISNNPLSEKNIRSLKEDAQGDPNKGAGLYYLRSVQRRRKSDPKDRQERVTETIVKACSLYTSNLNDFLTINLSPANEFISVNIHATDPECNNSPPIELSAQFNTTFLIQTSPLGPQPDTATYIKRLEEERQSKLKEGKEDNRSFLAKYWMYIVPGVIILMMLGGPEQGAR